MNKTKLNMTYWKIRIGNKTTPGTTTQDTIKKHVEFIKKYPEKYNEQHYNVIS